MHIARCMLLALALLAFTLERGQAAGVDAVFTQQQAPATTATTATTTAAGEVIFNGKTLFVIKGRALSFSAEERARAVSERLAGLAAESGPGITITAAEGEAATDILAGDRVVMSVTAADAEVAGISRQQLAAEYSEAMHTALAEYQAERSNRSILLGLAFAIVSTIALLLVLFLLRRLFPRLTQRLEAERGRFIKTIRIQSVELLKEEQILTLLHAVVRITKIIVYLLVFNLYLTTVLGLFPWTRGFAQSLTGYVLDPLRHAGQSFVNFLPNIFFIAVIVGVTYVIIRTIRIVFDAIDKRTITLPGFYAEWATPTFNILRFLIIAFVAVVIFPYLPGSDSPAFKGVSVFLGVLFSLGSSSAIANIVSGVILTYTRAFSLGDRVQIGDTVGDVVEKTLLVSRVRTIKNVDITIPNAMVLSSHVINYSTSAKSEGLILHTGVTIGYDVPWRQVHALLKDAALRTAHVLREPAPFVLQTSLDDFYVAYQINAYTDQPQNMATIYSELHQHIQDCFNEGGVEIMSPHYATLRDGNPTTIPASYLPANYRPPAIGVRLDRGES